MSTLNKPSWELIQFEIYMMLHPLQSTCVPSVGEDSWSFVSAEAASAAAESSGCSAPSCFGLAGQSRSSIHSADTGDYGTKKKQAYPAMTMDFASFWNTVYHSNVRTKKSAIFRLITQTFTKARTHHTTVRGKKELSHNCSQRTTFHWWFCTSSHEIYKLDSRVKKHLNWECCRFELTPENSFIALEYCSYCLLPQ